MKLLPVSSWPGLARPSTPWSARNQDVDARIKSAQDDFRELSSLARENFSGQPFAGTLCRTGLGCGSLSMCERVGAELEFDDERARQGLRCSAGSAGCHRVDPVDVEWGAV